MEEDLEAEMEADVSGRTMDQVDFLGFHSCVPENGKDPGLEWQEAFGICKITQVVTYCAVFINVHYVTAGPLDFPNKPTREFLGAQQCPEPEGWPSPFQGTLLFATSIFF